MSTKHLINQPRAGRWLILLLALLTMPLGLRAQESYGITVAGVEVTSDNASSITGANITAGTVSFDAQTNTLTLNNVTMSDNVVSSLAALNVKLVGVSTFNIDNSDGEYHYLFQSTNTSATLTFSADQLGATLQGYGTTVNYKLDLNSWFDVAYDNEDYWSSTTTQMDNKDYCQVSKPYVIVDGSAINDANKNNPDISGVSFDLTNNKVTLSGFQRENQSYNSYSLIKSNIANLNVDIQGGLNYIYLNTKKTNQEITSRGFIYTGASGQESSLNVTVAEGSKLLLSWSGETATTNWLQEGFAQTNMALDKTKMQEAGVLAEAGDPYGYQMTISNYTPPVSYGITVAGVEVTSENAGNITGANITDGTVSFDPQTNTLTLNNASIFNDSIVSGLDNLTVFLVGENIISSGSHTFSKTSAVEEATITFTTDEESMGSLFINNLENYLFGEGVTPVYSNVFIKHNGDGHTIDCQLGIRVGGVPVTLFNKDNVLGDGKVSYNPETYTLTLNNAKIEPEEETSGIVHSNAENLKIALIGNNSIQGGEGCSAISHYGGVETYSLSFAKGNAAQHFSLTLIAQSEDDLIDGFDTNYGDFFVFDNEDDGTYTSTISSSVFGGTGSADEPFLIKTTEDLKDFVYHYNEGRFSNNVHIQLFNDIDCKDEEGFSTIADNTDATFYGVFDGNHKTISNLTMTGVGFFGFVSKDDDFGVGTITNLTLSNFNLTGKSDCDATGGIVAELSDGAIVSNCSVENSIITCESNNSNPEVGGIVGRLNNSTVTGCTVNNVQVKAETTDTGGSGTSSNAGGIVGYISQGTISACEVENGTIRSSHVAANGYQSAGGIVGSCDIDEVITISNNMVKGSTTVSALDNTPEGVSGTPIAGAIVGQIGKSTALSNNTYEYSVTVSTKPSDAAATAVSGYTQRGSGNKVEFEGTDNYPELYVELNDLFEDNGAVMYTKIVTLPAESDQATVIGEEGTYYSTVMESDVQSILVAPGQTATLNAIPGDGLAIASLTVTNTTTSEAITTTSTMIEAGTMQYTFTMPDAPVTVGVTTATAYGVTVGDVAVTELNYSDVLGDGKVSWDNTNHILTLNGATIDGGIRCSLDGALTVLLQGQNVIDGGYVNANRNGARAFEGESQTTSLIITTDTDNPGQLLLKGTFVNQWDNAEYYSDNMYPSFNNGLVASQSNSDKKMLIAQGPVVTPGEGLYWTNQQYTIPTGTQISCSDNAGQPVDVSVNANSFALTKKGKYTVNISKAVTVDDTNFSLSNSGYYIVHNKPGFSAPAGTYTDSKTITLTNLPTLSETTNSYPQVWYYLDDNKNDSVLYTSVEQEITLTESTKVCVYIIDEDSGKVVKSANVEAEYTILKTPDYHFSDDPQGTSYYPNGSTVSNLNFGQENTLPWLINVPNGLAITYRSSDEATATIDQEGHITLTGAGHVWIYASNEETNGYVAHTDSIRLEIRPMDPQTSIAQGAYYTGQKLELISTVPNGEMYYQIGNSGDKVKYTEPLTLAKGKWEIYFYTKCGSGNDEMWSYGNNHPTYYVYDELTFTPESGTTSNDNITVEIGNLPSSTPNATSVFYFFGEDDEDDTNDLEYNTTDKVNVAESTKVTAYIKVEGDSGKVYKTEPVEAEYVIRTVPEMSFVSNNKPVEVAEWTIGGTENQPLPTLKNELQLQVTYSSTQTDVATVDNNGSVTPVGVGETSITATSTQTDIYQSTVTSYQLHVYKMLNHESITIEAIDDQPYTGAPIEPTVTVKDGQTDITNYVDIAYSNNVAVGTSALVTITPKETEVVNYYKGSATTSFNIVNRTLEEGKDVTFASGQSWASYFTNSETLEVPEGIVAYVLTGVNGGTLTAQAISKVPQNIPVLLEKTNNAVTTNDTYDVNLLQGTAEATSVTGIEGVVYVLYNGEFVRTKSGTIPAHRAYLVLSSDAGARLSIGFDDEATGIRNLEADGNGNDVWFSLDGQRFDKKPAKKGLYIHNGEKEFVK